MHEGKDLFEYLSEDRSHMVDFLVTLFGCDESVLLDFISESTSVLRSFESNTPVELKSLVEALLSEERSSVRL